MEKDEAEGWFRTLPRPAGAGWPIRSGRALAARRIGWSVATIAGVLLLVVLPASSIVYSVASGFEPRWLTVGKAVPSGLSAYWVVGGSIARFHRAAGPPEASGVRSGVR